MTVPRLATILALLGCAFPPCARSQADASWWSLQRVERPELPPLQDHDWPRNPIDHFVLAKLEAAGLRPAPEADARTLSRRLHFDLIGLPPEPGAGADIDALLASPHYGERWARHWLDIARFGESQGFEYDQPREHAWPFRDWVIKAFNEDMPYDRFVRWQIAGDRLAPSEPDAVIATSFLVCGAFDGLKPAGDKQRQIMRQDEVEDLVGTVAQTFLGLTVNCARCHDHKFDPISQKEYFQIASALAGVHRGDRELPPSREHAAAAERVRELSQKLQAIDAKARAAIARDQEDGGAVQKLAPQPISRWNFNEGLRDEIGQAHGQARGGAHATGGTLRLDGAGAYVTSAALPTELRSKTLEAWVKLADLNQRGGGVISVQNLDGGQFDAIVFGERDPGQWMAGSDGFSRSQSFNGEPESDAAGGFVHVAITYAEDGTITAYRNGLPYGEPYKTNPAQFQPGQYQVLFGNRHGTAAAAGRMLAGEIDRAQLYDRALSPEEVAASADVRIISEAEILAELSAEERSNRNQWSAEIARLGAELQQLAERRKVFAVTPQPPPIVHLLKRGNPLEPDIPVAAGGIAALTGAPPSDFGLAPDAADAPRRTRLAEWVTDPDNPLFARVMMNRLWHYHFGQGLVKTPNDFGFSGGTASHPLLLDWLAAEFRASGWSLKEMHRLIVDSATYRQSSAQNPEAHQIDADNRLLWRRSPSRLEAEVVRDSILKVAGALNPQMGGPGFRDFNMYKKKGSWVYDPTDPEGDEFNRRSIYRTWARGSVHPLLAPLDCPDPSTATPARSVTTTPLGALALMNTSFVLRMSDRFAQRLEAEAGAAAPAQVNHAFQLAFARAPNDEELAITTGFVKSNGLPALCRVLFNSNEFLYVN